MHDINEVDHLEPTHQIDHEDKLCINHGRIERRCFCHSVGFGQSLRIHKFSKVCLTSLVFATRLGLACDLCLTFGVVFFLTPGVLLR